MVRLMQTKVSIDVTVHCTKPPASIVVSNLKGSIVFQTETIECDFVTIFRNFAVFVSCSAVTLLDSVT